jgi:hypothetical protein
MRYLTWGLLLFSFIGFITIEKLFTIPTDITSGNGNLGILVILGLSPFFIAAYFLTVKMTRTILADQDSKKLNMIILNLCFVSWFILLFAIMNYTNELVAALGGSPANENSRISHFGWFNQYTNSLFFNVYAFFLIYLSSVIIGVFSLVGKSD